MASKTKKHDHEHIHTNLEPIARSDDGSIQLTLTIHWPEIEKQMEAVAVEMGETTTVPGFRKGKAPLDRLMTHFSKDTLVEKALYKLLPKLFAEAVETHKIAPIMYPKFEIITAQEGEDWQIRAITCEMPSVELGDYKSNVKNALSSGSIWTPNKGEESKKEPTREEKEEIALKTLVSSINVSVPSVLIEEEVNSRLVSLLERIEKLGLNLENYLASVKKTPESIRDEYKKQAEESIKLDLILTKIAQAEGIKITDEDLNAFLSVTAGDPALQSRLSTPEQKEVIKSILKKRKIIDSLTSLV